VNVVILGAPGSGKGTQASRIAERAGIRHISTGDLLREAVSRGTEIGKKASGIMASGGLVPDEIVLELIREKLTSEAERAGHNGWILDGYPRTPSQAEALEGVLGRTGEKIDAVVYIDLDAEVVVNRLSNRRTCVSCKAVYHLVSNPPEIEGQCDACGGMLVLRDDDKPDTIRKRLDVYRSETLPILALYERRHRVYRVDGSRPIDEVTSAIVGMIGL
jgi:adenylate kinase